MWGKLVIFAVIYLWAVILLCKCLSLCSRGTRG